MTSFSSTSSQSASHGILTDVSRCEIVSAHPWLVLKFLNGVLARTCPPSSILCARTQHAPCCNPTSFNQWQLSKPSQGFQYQHQHLHPSSSREARCSIGERVLHPILFLNIYRPQQLFSNDAKYSASSTYSYDLVSSSQQCRTLYLSLPLARKMRWKNPPIVRTFTIAIRKKETSMPSLVVIFWWFRSTKAQVGWEKSLEREFSNRSRTILVYASSVYSFFLLL